MKKKTLALALLTCLSAVLTACGGAHPGEESPTSISAQSLFAVDGKLLAQDSFTLYYRETEKTDEALLPLHFERSR